MNFPFPLLAMFFEQLLNFIYFINFFTMLLVYLFDKLSINIINTQLKYMMIITMLLFCYLVFLKCHFTIAIN